MGKVSDQISQFTETYSAIVLGMHSDMNQYRQDVKSLRDNSLSLENKLYQIVSGTKSLEQSNIQISKKIEERKGEIEKYYNKISASVEKIDLLAKEVNKVSSLAENLDLKVAQSKNDIIRLNSKSVEQQGKIIQLNSDLTSTNSKAETIGSEVEELKSLLSKQAEQMATQKLMIFGCIALIFFILVLTLFL